MTGSAVPANIAASNLRILRGHPTDEQIAALVAVLAALRASAPRTELVQPRLRRPHDHRRRGHRSAVSWRGHRL